MCLILIGTVWGHFRLMLWDLYTLTNWYSRTGNAADKKQFAGLSWSWSLALSCSTPALIKVCGPKLGDHAWPSSSCCSTTEPRAGWDKGAERDKKKERNVEREFWADTGSLVVPACLAFRAERNHQLTQGGNKELIFFLPASCISCILLSYAV